MDVQTVTPVRIGNSARPLALSLELFERLFEQVDTTRTPIKKLAGDYGISRTQLHKYLRKRGDIESEIARLKEEREKVTA